MQENLRQALRAEWATDRYFRYSFDENITPSAVYICPRNSLEFSSAKANGEAV